jgi:hypothetical protein
MKVVGNCFSFSTKRRRRRRRRKDYKNIDWCFVNQLNSYRSILVRQASLGNNRPRKKIKTSIT